MRGSFLTTKIERLRRFAFSPITQEPDYKSVRELDYCFSELTSTEMILMPISVHFLISVTAYHPNFTLWSPYCCVTSLYTAQGVCEWSDNKRSHCSVWLKKKKSCQSHQTNIIQTTTHHHRQRHIILEFAQLLFLWPAAQVSAQREHTLWTSCSRLINKCCIMD